MAIEGELFQITNLRAVQSQFRAALTIAASEAAFTRLKCHHLQMGCDIKAVLFDIHAASITIPLIASRLPDDEPLR